MDDATADCIFCALRALERGKRGTAASRALDQFGHGPSMLPCMLQTMSQSGLKAPPGVGSTL
eukprot:1587528-Amphidinium_carterae.1